MNSIAVIMIIYMTNGLSNYSATGGPTTLYGFSSIAACEKAIQPLKEKLGSRFDWATCLEVQTK